MCGIAGVYLRDPEAKANLDGLLSSMLDMIEHRGGDATGFVAMGNEGVLEWQKAAVGSKDFNLHRRSVPEGTRSVVGHTRWATQGLPGFVENNHPLRRGSFFVVHNGHISNDAKLFELANRERFGQVDSEAIPARFASFGKLDAAPKVMAELHGAAAIAAVDENAPSDIVLARGSSSPLFVLQTKRYVLFASTEAAIKVAWKENIGSLPRRAKITSVPEGTVLHFKDGKLHKRSFKVYTPPKVAWKGSNLTLPWKEVSTEFSTSSVTKWDPNDDMLDCDACGKAVSWKDMDYRYDAEDRTTYNLCPECDALWEYEAEKIPSGIHGALDAEWQAVNAVALNGDGSDEDE